ncbi:MAG: hypothetical protein AAB544_04945 [Patescibacteria group bacterium]
MPSLYFSKKAIATATALLSAFSATGAFAQTPGSDDPYTSGNLTVPDNNDQVKGPSFADLGYMPFRSQRGRDEDEQFPKEFDPDFYLQDVNGNNDFININMMPVERISQLFERIGVEREPFFSNNNGQIYDNDTFSDSEIDLRQLVSHQCFYPVNQEILDCMQEFGPYYDLGAAMDTGLLRDLLITGNPNISDDMIRLYDAMVWRFRQQGLFDRQGIQVSGDYTGSLDFNGGVTAEQVEEERSLFNLSATQRMDLRAQFIWSVCASKYQSWGETAMCYQRNERLVTDNDMGLHIEGSDVDEDIR